MKKIISAVICLIFTAISFCSCGNTQNTTDNGKLSIVTTIFPEYDWVRMILSDNAENVNLTMLLDNGVDLHNYQPSVDDIIKISTCDMFIYVGGESDNWVNDTLAEATNNMIVINLLDVLGDSVKEEELADGMQEDEHEDNEHDSEETEYDEHVWLSLRNAEILCTCIADKLGEIDAKNRDSYAANASAYIEKLRQLDNEYKEAVNGSPVKTILFGDRFPFRYMADDYGLSYYAAFAGCSAETEASFETITFLAEKVDELELSSIITLEGSDGKIAQTIVSSSKNQNAQILSMDSMQSIVSADVDGGITYLSVMEKNLETLKKALQ